MIENSWRSEAIGSFALHRNNEELNATITIFAGIRLSKVVNAISTRARKVLFVAYFQVFSGFLAWSGKMPREEDKASRTLIPLRPELPSSSWSSQLVDHKRLILETRARTIVRSRTG